MTIFPKFELCVSIVCQFCGHSRKPLLRADIIFVKEIEKLLIIIKKIVNRISLGKLLRPSLIK